MKKLHRSREDVVFAGILGGIAEYYETDPLVARLIFLFLLLATGLFPGLLFYIIAMIIIPQRPLVS